MKKIILIILVIFVESSLFACKNNNVPIQNNSNNIERGERQNGTMGSLDKSGDEVLQNLIKSEVPKFKTYTYKDQDSGIEIIYNLYVPKNYDKNKKYPLVQFIPDASLFGKPAESSLTQGYGALVWTTDEAQAKNECFVYVPTFNQGLKNDYPELNVRMSSIVDDDSHFSEDVFVNIDCIKNLCEEYSIDTDRIYTTGQSMGGITSFFYACYFNDIFAAYMPVGSQFDTELIDKLNDRNIIYLVSEGDTKASQGMNNLKASLDENGTNYSYAYFSIKDSLEKQNKIVKEEIDKDNNYNLFMFKKGEVVPEGVNSNNEHMFSFDYAYKIDAAREYLFSKTKPNINKTKNDEIQDAINDLNKIVETSASINDYQNIYNTLIVASLNQNMKAPRYVGLMYENGYGVDKDYIKAYMYYKIAAIRGDITSNYYLGLMYLNGYGVKQNEARAKKYLEIAANSNNENATGVKEAREMVDNKNNSSLKLTIDGAEVNVLWEDNASVNELKELVKNNSLKIETHQHGGFEQVGEIGRSITSNNTQMTTTTGDIVLYAGNNIVIFYGSNSWSYTKLGKIIDKADEELKTMLNKNNVIIELSQSANE